MNMMLTRKGFCKLGHGVYLVDGAMSLDDVNDRLGLSLYSEDYDSIGGLMIEKLDHIPVRGRSSDSKEISVCPPTGSMETVLRRSVSRF